MQLTTFQTYYLAGWLTLVVAAAVVLLRRRRGIELFSRTYWQFLGRSWKVAAFVFALVGINLLAPISGDPTWDYVDASFMAIFAYTTAPWSVGTVVRGLRRRGAVPPAVMFAAVVVWLFSASWSYDLYLLWRDGLYPVTWSANLVASSALYLGAGVFWSLDWTEDGGIHLAFARDDWPSPDGADFRDVAPYALPLIAVIGLLFLMFPVLYFTGWSP